MTSVEQVALKQKPQIPINDKSKTILIKNHVRKVGEKSTQTGGLDTRHLQLTTLLHLEHYI